ncbi:MAG: hypothetical protein JO235_03365 [Chroococcidiopsidaceae cyanobacterium CP_BM_RX_35]|nr:hypothetical protein [Chroococcidiopsidaceae cyanobacterium CP_BM_RX_35]
MPASTGVGAIAASLATIGVAGYVVGSGVSGLADQTGLLDASPQSAETSNQPNSQSNNLVGNTLSAPGNTTSNGNTKAVPEPPATIMTIGLALGAGILLKVLKKKKVFKADTKQH